MIVENGLGAVDELTEDGQIHDDYRIDYMRQHIEEMKETVCDGVDLMGYTCWGCTDVTWWDRQTQQHSAVGKAGN